MTEDVHVVDVNGWAGWYPDPSGQPGRRYFDGTTWTEHAVRAQRMSDKQRTERLEQVLTTEVSRGARVESRTAFNAVVVFQPPKVNHILHLLLCFLTCWLWLIFWAMEAGKREQRFLTEVDPYGVVTCTRTHSS